MTARNIRRCATILKASFTHLRMRACTHTPRERASERGEREREREREGGRERARERERVHAPFFKCVLLITLLASSKHTPTYPASSAPDTRCRRALPKPCNVAPTRTRPHPARAGTAHTPAHATRDRPTRARACRRPSDGACPPGTAESSAQEHGTHIGILTRRKSFAGPVLTFGTGVNLPLTFAYVPFSGRRPRLGHRAI